MQGPLLGYESFTGFILEATFFGVMLLGRERVSPRFYFFACCMVALGTTFSSFWILANNSWMQVPLGHTASKSISALPPQMGTMLIRSIFSSVTRPLLSHGLVVGKHPQDTLVCPLMHTSRF